MCSLFESVSALFFYPCPRWIVLKSEQIQDRKESLSSGALVCNSDHLCISLLSCDMKTEPDFLNFLIWNPEWLWYGWVSGWVMQCAQPSWGTVLCSHRAPRTFWNPAPDEIVAQMCCSGPGADNTKAVGSIPVWTLHSRVVIMILVSPFQLRIFCNSVKFVSFKAISSM